MIRLLRKLLPFVLAVLAGIALAGQIRGHEDPTIDQAPAITCEGEMCWWADQPRPTPLGERGQ